jgi:hypothetical protein
MREVNLIPLVVRLSIATSDFDTLSVDENSFSWLNTLFWNWDRYPFLMVRLLKVISYYQSKMWICRCSTVICSTSVSIRRTTVTARSSKTRNWSTVLSRTAPTTSVVTAARTSCPRPGSFTSYSIAKRLVTTTQPTMNTHSWVTEAWNLTIELTHKKTNIKILPP